jgi:hypothetical protein
MKTKNLSLLAALLLSGAAVSSGRAGQELKWDDVPEAVRAAVLAHGGTAGQPVDRENGKRGGLAVYEAGVKDKDGTVADLVITEDGKLVETKHDDAADAAAEQAAAGKPVFARLKFSHPRDIMNPLLPLAYLKQDILGGTEEGAKVRVERTLLPEKHKVFKIQGQKVESLVMEDREFHNGALEEVTLDYFAQDDEGNVYYLGEDVDDYEDGKVTGHDGAWMLGRGTKHPGVIIPAHPQAGDKFMSEDVNPKITENDEIVSVSETVSVPAGTFENCVKVKESSPDGSVEYKFYAPGTGVVREVPASGDELLISHTTR